MSRALGRRLPRDKNDVESARALVALRLLVVHDLADRAWLKEWARFKRKRLGELLAQADALLA
jgi:hypothetical protein